MRRSAKAILLVTAILFASFPVCAEIPANSSALCQEYQEECLGGNQLFADIQIAELESFKSPMATNSTAVKPGKRTKTNEILYQFIKLTDTCPGMTHTAGTRIVKVAGNELNLRSKSSTASKILATFGRKDILRILDTKKDWLKVIDNKCREGWVAGFLTIEVKVDLLDIGATDQANKEGNPSGEQDIRPPPPSSNEQPHDRDELETGIRDDSKEPTAREWILKARELWKNGRYLYPDLAKEFLENAIEGLDEAIKRGPEDAGNYYNRGLAYYYLEKYWKAVEDQNRTIELNPKDAAAYYNRGLAYAKLNKNQKAVDDYNHAIDLNPTHAKAYSDRGLSYLIRKENNLACADFKKACDLGDCQLYDMTIDNGECSPF